MFKSLDGVNWAGFLNILSAKSFNKLNDKKVVLSLHKNTLKIEFLKGIANPK